MRQDLQRHRALFFAARLLALALSLSVSSLGAYEIGTAVDAGTAEYRGFSFVPTQTGLSPSEALLLPELLPQSLEGRSYLSVLELRLEPGTVAPEAVHLYASVPPAAESAAGIGALRTATRPFCRVVDAIGQACIYNFDDLELAADSTYYAVFSSCASMVVSAIVGQDDYPAGAPLVDSDCSQPDGGSLSVLPGNDNAAFVGRFLNPGPFLVADYLAGHGGESVIAGAPPLTGSGLAQVGSAQIDGRTVATHPLGDGLTLTLDGLLSAGNYTIAMLVRLDSVAGFRKLLDLAGGTSDAGLYVVDGQLNFFNLATGGPGAVAADTWVQVVLQRNLGVLIGVVDTQQQFLIGDSSTASQIQDAQELRFFVDDQVTGGSEMPSGEWARIRIFDAYLGYAQLENMTRLPPLAQDRFENDNLPLRADLGNNGSAAFFRTFHETDDEDWIYGAIPCETSNDWSNPSVRGFLLRSQDPRFQPLVEIYPQAALVVPATPPLATFGACGEPGPLRLPVIEDRFARIRNCPDVALTPGAPLAYRIEALNPDSTVCSPGILISGSVTEQGSGDPVGGVFIVGNDNSAGFSAPGTGAYRILVTDFDEMVLNVVSDQWQADPVVVPTAQPGFGITLDIPVQRKSGLFGDGFEVRDDPFAP